MNFRWLFVSLALVLFCGFATLGTQNFSVANAETIYTPQNISLENVGEFTDITIDGKIIYVSDKTKYQIFKYNTENNTTTITDTTPYNCKPDKITFNYADNLLCSLSNANKIMTFDKNLTEYSSFWLNEQNPVVLFDKIVDIAQSSNNVVWAIVESNEKSYLIKKEQGKQQFSVVSELTLAPTSKLAVNLTGNVAFLLENDKIYDISGGAKIEQNIYTIPALTNIKSIYFDHKNDLFILDANNKITHCKQDGFSQINISNTADVLDFCINPFNQSIYLITKTNLSVITPLGDDQNFLNPISTTPSINIETNTITAPLKFGTINTNTFVFKYDNMLDKSYGISQGTNVFVLDEMEDNNFYYILNTSKEFNSVGYVLKSDLTLTTSQVSTQKFETLLSSTPIYPFPSSLKNENSTETRTVGKLERGTQIVATLQNEIPTDRNGCEFAFVSVTQNGETVSGYVDTHSLFAVGTSEEIKELFIPNAVTKTEISIFEDNELKTTKTNLPESTAVQIVSRNGGIALVKWDDGEGVNFGYTKCENLDDGSITTTQILGFLLMLASLIVILVMIKVYKNNKRKFALDYEK